MATAAKKKTNPTEPTGAATEKVYTYFRTPRFKKGREWLERELGQIRLFEYNPAKLKVEKVGAKYGLFLNNQLIGGLTTKAKATKRLKTLKNRASDIQNKKRNPANNNEIAADVAKELIQVFDIDDDGEVDKADIRKLKDFDLPKDFERKLVLDVNRTGNIVKEMPNGDVLIRWMDGVETIEPADTLATQNGLKSWYYRQRAGRQYKKGLKLAAKAKKARKKESDFASKANPAVKIIKSGNLFYVLVNGKRIKSVDGKTWHHHRREVAERVAENVQNKYKKNPGLLAAFAELAVGIDSAMSIHNRLKKPNRKPANTKEQKRKTNPSTSQVKKCEKVIAESKRETHKPTISHWRDNKDNPSIREAVKAARKAGNKLISIVKADLETVRNYAKRYGGSVRKNSKTNRYAFHLPKAKANCPTKPAVKTRGNIPNSSAQVKHVPGMARLYANYKAFQGRDAKKVFEAHKPDSAPEKLWTLGKLFEIKVRGKGTYNFRREKTNRTFWLCSDAKNVQLWIAGAKFAGKDYSCDKDEFEVIGEITAIVYETEKAHLGDAPGEPSPYIHFLADEGGERPYLAIDRNGFASIVGGGYYISPLGIGD
jgi:hypothetical protein